MGKIIILGSASAVPDAEHENTHFAIQGKDKFILVDCVGNPLVRLQQAGLDFHDLNHLILTHFHPDHVSGVPLLLMDMWLLGRKAPLTVHGLEHTLGRVENLLKTFGWEDWPNFFPVTFQRVPEQPLAPVLETDEFRVLASPVEHLIPTIGLRVEARANGRTLAYSCDTQPSAAVVKLAEGADVLIHEATGETLGHSSARQAAELAQEVGVKRLYLIHYGVHGVDPRALLPQAGAVFSGEVALAEDFMAIEI